MSRLFRDVEGGTLFPHGSVVCIGAFDGLHLGHQALVRHAVERARALGVPAVAVSFEPLPREFFANDTPPPRLTLARAKIEGLYGFGADSVGMIRFDGRLSAMSAQDFVRLALVGRLCAREVWIGPEFRFGHRRGGDIALLRALGEQHGFAAGEIAPVHLRGERISATRIRELLVAGEFAHAGELLGRPYAIGGRVVRGKQLGRTLGYPTANLRFSRTPALSGIYATWVHGVAVQPWPSVSSFGTRPTVAGIEPLLEAHLFDFQGDLYGRHIAVEFVAKLRDEEKFDGLEALTVQMHRDAEQARAVLATHARTHSLPQHADAQHADAPSTQTATHTSAETSPASPSQSPAHARADGSHNAAQR
ncbi:bifunctional riboflavin kinase/FAD synthetase [Xanthomonas campestris]|uniref:bifunctional riboflavin kinase/FAD synthetase n=1 Tax=Xanthomonas campestris TaxID=339 RepID=UPI00096D30DE|nr:bifunctional riboflavin kinase/FAD synthetase [Xanthomonas campestris]MDX6082441.1 bifunctional riboflavin kinase/FAD synthetase [Xanthomonas campestris pv. incanae]MDX6086658.1 bifunctional riboflavin kinase/FAD synthetase [Xanthomonas campestris pv. incanae]MDX6139777.1 bifunctional riboflavin kinase/FAD synthetase [Xanthomonas campestris pv. incanae]WDJ02936.1 bifunctional riboflavin kinase/FAD synthetase [Xanthomonas campestris]WDJ90971.1 bifunctional riboflavin kinase/FAD synthetase [X